jgi:AcrR family transcriptional regulator
MSKPRDLPASAATSASPRRVVPRGGVRTSRTAARGSARKTSRRRLPEQRPHDILDAALESFVENGFAATRLEDVAERAGVSKGTLYLYFENKEELFKAAVRENIVPFLDRAEHRVRTFEGSSRELFTELVHDWWNAMHESRVTGLPKLILAEASNFPDAARFFFEAVVERVRRLFARVLRRGIRSGEFRPIDVEYAVRITMAPVVMGLIWKHSLVKCRIDAIDFDRQLATLIDLTLHGLLRDSSKGRS